MAVETIRLNLAVQWMVPMLAGRRVLDASLPAGLVSDLLSDCGVEVLCFTPRRAMADILTQRFGPAVDVYCSEFGSIPLPDRSIDCAICFDPDLGAVDVGGFVEELGRIVTDDGLIAVSSPGRASGGNGYQDAMTTADLEAALVGHFEHVSSIRQTFCIVSRLGTSVSGAIAGAFPDTNDPASFSTASDAFVLASRRALPDLSAARTVARPIELAKYEDLLDESLRLARSAQSRAEVAERANDEREYLIEELYRAEQYVAGAFDVRTRQESLLALATEELTTLRAELKACREAGDNARQSVLDMKQSTSWRVTAPLRFVKRVGSTP